MIKVEQVDGAAMISSQRDTRGRIDGTLGQRRWRLALIIAFVH